MNFKKTVLVLFLLAITTQALWCKPPRLTMVIILDQFSHHELQALKGNLTGGIKRLLDNGVCYENAYMPHATPETAVGHAALSTGALPKDHGIVANSWFNQDGIEISSDQDDAKQAAVFAPHGFYQFGRSANNIMVDGLSDQVMLKPTGKKKYAAVAISHKSRAALASAGKLGKAFWLDLHTGFFTSSKAVVNELPAWVIAFNQKKKINELTSVSWPLFYPKKKHAYAMSSDNYDFSGAWGLAEQVAPMAGTEISLEHDRTPLNQDNGPYDLLAKTPAGNQLLIDFAKACLDEYIDQQKVSHLVLWVSCSTLDKIGHPYGPYSLEKIDSLYHLDAQLQVLIDYAQRKVGDENVLFALTSDHGIAPIPETVREKGYTQARRIYTPDLVAKMNVLVENKYGIQQAVVAVRDNNFYLNIPVLKTVKPTERKAIVTSLKRFLELQPGIKNVWTFQELANANYHLELKELEALYKNQLFKGRSGHIICQPYPYVIMSTYHRGTNHNSPYGYDTHIPLVLYQKNRFKHAVILNHVWAQQLPVTLAHLLEVPAPSASTFSVLPAIF